MMRRLWILTLAFGIGACGSGGSSDDAMDAGSSPEVDAGQNPDPDDQAQTLSPLDCQTDLEIIREENGEVGDPPLAYKGEFFGFRFEDDTFRIKALASDTDIAVQGQKVSGFPSPLLIGTFSSELVTAPDHGLQNDVSHPVAFLITNGILRSDGAGGLIKVLAGFDNFTATSPSGSSVAGIVGGFSNLVMGPEGELAFQLLLKGDNKRHLVVAAPNGRFSSIISAGSQVNGNLVVSIDEVTSTPSGMIIRTTLSNGGATGTGYFFTSGLGGGVRCMGADPGLTCNGLSVPTGFTMDLENFYTDGFTTGGVMREGGSTELHYQVAGRAPGVIRRGETVQGFELNNFGHPRACGRDNSLYFAGQIGSGSRARYELMRVDANGVLSQLSNFGSLLDNSALAGDVPDEIMNMALSYGCDVVLRMKGDPRAGETVPYEGYWISYFGGDTIEALDETPGRADNGNGTIQGVTRSRSGIDPNANPIPTANIGPKGDFTLLLQIPNGATAPGTYARATRPKNRCHEPSIVNSDEDSDDQSPGDGNCDTGATVGGDAECTLRAAIQETNATAGSDTIEFEGVRTIMLSAPLPPVTGPVNMAGNATIVGTLLTGEEVGLDIKSPGCFLGGLQIEGFPSHGIRSDAFLETADVNSIQNCGWGFYLEAGGELSGNENQPMLASDNGNGDGCSAGGVFASAEEARLRLAYAQTSSNNGPGVLSRASVSVSHVTANDNFGDGIVVDSEGAELRLALGTLTTSGNRGHGISLTSANLIGRIAAVKSERNCGWGVLLDSGVVRLEAPFGLANGRHVFSTNGLTPPDVPGGFFWRLDNNFLPETISGSCGGGGIGVLEGEFDGTATESHIAQADLHENQGPGMATTAPFRLSSMDIQQNFGPGVLLIHDDTKTVDRGRVLLLNGNFGPSTISSNAGAGIDMTIGTFVADGNLDIESNSGAGIRILEGDVRLHLGNNIIPGRTLIRANGQSQENCGNWSVVGGEFVVVAGTCNSNQGIRVDAGDISAVGARILNSGGAGLSAIDGDNDGKGIVDMVGGEVCNNGAPNEGETITLTSVDITCTP